MFQRVNFCCWGHVIEHYVSRGNAFNLSFRPIATWLKHQIEGVYLQTVFLEYDMIKSNFINCGIFYIMWNVILMNAIFETS